jgi:hypothetical protein
MVNFGYHNRVLSSWAFVVLLTLLWGFHFYIVFKIKKINIFKLALGIGILSLFSYPFLSHDLFSYIFDAKILTFYGQNPYTTIPGSFPDDPWLRFMHWTHRSYPYGPVFLPITLIPSLIGAGIFLLNFIFFKLLFVGAYLIAVFALHKLDKNSARFFATHPLVIIEGLVNTHNDLIAVSLSCIGSYLLFKNKNVIGRLTNILSFGIKYMTFFTIFLTKDKKFINLVSFLGSLALLLYLYLFMSQQSWYFLLLLIYLPWYKDFIYKLWLFNFGLLISYYPFVRYGEGAPGMFQIRDIIVLFFSLANLIYILWSYRKSIFEKKSYEKHIRDFKTTYFNLRK